MKIINIYDLLSQTSNEYLSHGEYYNLSNKVNTDINKFCDKYGVELDKYLGIISNNPNLFNDGDMEASRIAMTHILVNKANIIATGTGVLITMVTKFLGIDTGVTLSSITGFLAGALGVSVADVPSIYSIDRNKNEIYMKGLFLAYIILTSYNSIKGISKNDRIHFISKLVKEKIRNNDDPEFERILYSIRHSIKLSLKNYKKKSHKETHDLSSSIFIDNHNIVIDMMLILLGDYNVR